MALLPVSVVAVAAVMGQPLETGPFVGQTIDRAKSVDSSTVVWRPVDLTTKKKIHF